MKGIRNGRQDVQHLLLETWKSFARMHWSDEYMGQPTLFVSIWQQTLGDYQVFFVKNYVSINWNGFLNVYLATYIYCGKVNISLFSYLWVGI
jgi:hypothetical protein